MAQKTKVIFIHGNGDSSPQDNWWPYLKDELEKLDLHVVARQFPDAPLARAKYWLPFLKNELHADEHTILIGHSSGAAAAMRYAESNRLLGSILVGAMHTDLGIETETLSGYFDHAWDWSAIKNNNKWITLFASSDDPWIPIEEPRFIRDQITPEYFEFKDQGHFGGDYFKPDFPEIVKVIKARIKTD